MQKRHCARRRVAIGRLVEEAGLLALVEEDLVALFGGFLRLADLAREDRAGALVAWRGRFWRPFDDDEATPAPASGAEPSRS
jgi:hypothetical protein